MCCQQPTLVAGRADKGTGIEGKTGLFTQLAAPIAGATVASIQPKHMAGNAVKARTGGGHVVSIIRHKVGDSRACRRGAAKQSLGDFSKNIRRSISCPAKHHPGKCRRHLTNGGQIVQPPIQDNGKIAPPSRKTRRPPIIKRRDVTIFFWAKTGQPRFACM